MSKKEFRAVCFNLHISTSFLARFVLKQFDKHSAKWAKLCRERGLSKEESMRWLNEVRSVKPSALQSSGQGLQNKSFDSNVCAGMPKD